MTSVILLIVIWLVNGSVETRSAAYSSIADCSDAAEAAGSALNTPAVIGRSIACIEVDPATGFERNSGDRQ